MRKLLPFLLAAILPLTVHAQHQSVTVLPNGLGAGTFNTAGITYYYGGGNTFDFTGSTIINGGLTVTATAVYLTVNQANSFVAGQPVTINSSGVYIGASANSTLAAANAVGIVSSTGLSSTSFQVVIDGICSVSGGSFTTGSIYYVPLSPGIVTATAPVTTGQYVYPVATALSASILSVSTSTPSIVTSFALTASGPPANTQVAYWTSATNLTGSNNLTFSGTQLTALGIGTGSGNLGINTNPSGATALVSLAALGSATNVEGAWEGTLTTNSNTTTQYGELIQETVANGAHTSIGYNGIYVNTPTVTGNALTSGYMLNVQAPAAGMQGAINVVSGAVNLGSGTTTVGGNLAVTGTSTLTGNVTVGAGGTGTGTNTLVVNGPNGTNSGGYVQFQKNTTIAGSIGNFSALQGGVTGNNDLLIQANAGNQILLYSAGAVALTLDASQNATFAGGIKLTKTVAGSTGAQTQNTSTGEVQFAGAATSLVVTNSLCSSTSIITVTICTNDATAVLQSVVKAAGSFTINMKVAPTGTTLVDYQLTN